ncbi:MAG: hypothetical protein ACKVOY_06715 [Burkholderiaceae bacterium]
MQLIQPTVDHLQSYLQTLERGWNPLYYKHPVPLTLIEAMEKDPERFISLHHDPTGELSAQKFKDGPTKTNIPSITKWMWDGDYAGSIDIRWQYGKTDLPVNSNGHIGYTVPPWKRKKATLKKHCNCF